MALTQIKSTLLAPQAVGWVPIAQNTPSSDATTAFESGIDSAYDVYMMMIYMVWLVLEEHLPMQILLVIIRESSSMQLQVGLRLEVTIIQTS